MIRPLKKAKCGRTIKSSNANREVQSSSVPIESDSIRPCFDRINSHFGESGLSHDFADRFRPLERNDRTAGGGARLRQFARLLVAGFRAGVPASRKRVALRGPARRP